jgi:DNA repair protein RadA/Sms
MAQVKTIYVCQECGVQSPKWMGKCLSCNGWNTFVEEIVEKRRRPVQRLCYTCRKPAPDPGSNYHRKDGTHWCGYTEFDRVLGGGIVPGSIVLLGGEPGIGKSTLVLQMALGLKDKKILYISGEESLQQIKLRAGRLGMNGSNCLFLSETSLEACYCTDGTGKSTSFDYRFHTNSGYRLH